MNHNPSPASASRSWGRHVYVNVTITVVVLLLILWTSISPSELLSNEGVRLLSKGALLVVALLVAAFAKTVVGRNPKRQFRMALGTIGGLATGVAVAPPLSAWIGADVSSLSAMCGVFLGWAVAYQFVKQIPRGGPGQPAPWRAW